MRASQGNLRDRVRLVLLAGGAASDSARYSGRPNFPENLALKRKDSGGLAMWVVDSF